MMALPKSGIPQQPCEGHRTELFVCLCVMHVWCLTSTLRLYVKNATGSDGREAGTVFSCKLHSGVHNTAPKDLYCQRLTFRSD